jgi:hypothetical protein
VVVEENLLMMDDHYLVKRHLVVLQVLDHVVLAVETRKNVVDFD